MSTKRSILGWVAVHFAVGSGRDPQYPQTWALVSRLPWHWARQLVARLCGAWGGHEWSATEWGWGGTQMCDRWCRWCNAFSEQPLSETVLTDVQRDLIAIMRRQDGGSDALVG